MGAGSVLVCPSRGVILSYIWSSAAKKSNFDLHADRREIVRITIDTAPQSLLFITTETILLVTNRLRSLRS